MQIELDWRRHSENAERDQYQKSEALIQSLLTARDQVGVASHSLQLSTEDWQRHLFMMEDLMFLNWPF